MGNLTRDVRYGLRGLLKSPTFSAIAVIALAFGVGATTAGFSIINAVLLRPFPVKEAERLVSVWQSTALQSRAYVTPADFRDFKEQNSVFESMSACYSWSTNLTGVGEPVHITAYRVSADFFQTLGVDSALGRTFRPDEGDPGKSHVIVLSHGLWTRHFAADPGIVNQTVLLGRETYTVVGVMPSSFQYPRGSAELWTPIPFDGEEALDRQTHQYLVTSRLKPGVTQAQAEAEVELIANKLAEQYPDTNAGYSAWLLPVRELILGPASENLFTSLIASFFVLLIACANVSNMLLARGTGRQKEIAIRLSLGASRYQLIRQLLTESLILSIVGAFLGCLLASWGLKLLVNNIPSFISDVSPRVMSITVDVQSLAFTLAISVAAVLIFGLAPALIASKPDLSVMLKEAARGSTGFNVARYLRNLLIVAQVALAVIILIGSGLLVRSYSKVLSANPGFNADGVLTVGVPLTSSYDSGRKVADFFKQGIQRTRAVPGVGMAAAIDCLPLGGSENLRSITVEGRPAPLPGQEQYIQYRVISPDYFQTMRIPFLSGRDFVEKDIEGAPPVALVSESLARDFWSNEDVIGKRIILEDETKPREIIGIVGDVNDWDLLGKTADYVYVPYVLEEPSQFMTLILRSNSDPASLAPAVKGSIGTLDSMVQPSNMRTMEKVVSDARSPQRLSMMILTVLAGVSMILAWIGVYGVASYSVVQRTREMGIRIALGARPRDVAALVTRQGMKVVLVGIAAGLVGAFALTRGMAGLLYGVNPQDPVTYLSVPLVLILAALLATFIPAVKASRVDPTTALRSE